ncbi:TerB family tellurite resistance protein [Thermithiobacillus tepidarius DSM 3134]|uniref:tellurite resistance TerB family protein n=1 Tax=Thermithiobacillus tepidarius TaxID=929 RepID=UPI0003FC51FB|nr:TerB family tellurite resistance protein [Thermithiobacillus tepidarius]
MIDAIKQFFDKYLAGSADARTPAGEHALQLATAALLIELTRLDDTVHDEERQAVSAAVQRKFGLSAAETAELVRLAEAEARQATSYYQFTSLINKAFTLAQKIQVVEHLWEIALADAELHRYEEHMIRRIADLLYVPHPDFIAAKHRVQARLGGA